MCKLSRRYVTQPRFHHLRQQGEKAGLPRQIVRQKVPPVAARFQPLGDDGVGPVRLQPQRFFNRGGAGEHESARALDALQRLRRRQPEVKAHHRRPEFGHQCGGFVVKRLAARAGWNVRRIQPQLVEIRPMVPTSKLFS